LYWEAPPAILRYWEVLFVKERRRIEYPGAFYHVIQRGNNREKIFRSDADKNFYLQSLVELKKQYYFKLLGYALMDTHYHVMMQTAEVPLSKIIFRQNMLYSRYFNKTHSRSGHLYSGPYNASLIQDENYLFAVLRYIHNNPVKAGICKTPEKFNWSSDKYYRSNHNEIADTDFILNILSSNRETALREYFRLMQVVDEVNYGSLNLIGDESFINAWQKEEEQNLPKNFKSKSLDEILKSVCADDDNYQLIKAGSRKRSLVPLKACYVSEAVNQGYNYDEIGANIGISKVAVAKITNKQH